MILAAQSRSDIKKMLNDLAQHALKYGLKINFAKTKIMTWSALAGMHTAIQVGTESVAILEEESSERYLGRKLAVEKCMEIEFRNRIAAGWAAFHKHKNELCNKFYRLSDRAKLFESVVTPAVLYGSSTWALTLDMEKQLQIARRRMLRYVFRIHRCTKSG